MARSLKTIKILKQLRKLIKILFAKEKCSICRIKYYYGDSSTSTVRVKYDPSAKSSQSLTEWLFRNKTTIKNLIMGCSNKVLFLVFRWVYLNLQQSTLLLLMISDCHYVVNVRAPD